MIVPRFWAEARVQHREKRKQVTIRRYGWSDTSQAEAQSHADARAADAMARVLAGEKLHRRDHKIPYNGAEGLPIREEVLSTHGDVVITRNSYGAHCLNTPNVLFADVDLEESKSWMGMAAFGCSVVLTAIVYPIARDSDLWQFGNLALLAVLFIVICSACMFVVGRLEKRDAASSEPDSGGPDEAALARVREFSARHPDWCLRVYRTPAGFRVLAAHSTFAANQPEVAECFSSLKVDPVYRQMCLNQQCFRARLTAKPWRAGIAAHMRPRPGVWPIKPEQVLVRAAWVAEYERAAYGYAACRYLETLGSGVVHPAVRPVIDLHDSRSRALSQLPLA